MFKIARSTSPRSQGVGKDDLPMLSQFCVSEAWSGDLSTGLLKLGERAVSMHGLDSGECGLLNLVRRYDPNDRAKLLELFEQATTHSSSFCFSTIIHNPLNGRRQPLFCIGESTGLERKYSGTIYGVFLFPHFTLQQDAAVAANPGYTHQ
ncbi:hypothetical protein [Rhizobium sp. C4]|uniref:hypothetical protein n=1 Tax=Rhizobium sp. C4 TaxID=1349800 RepID=UPI003FA77F94